MPSGVNADGAVYFPPVGEAASFAQQSFESLPYRPPLPEAPHVGVLRRIGLAVSIAWVAVVMGVMVLFFVSTDDGSSTGGLALALAMSIPFYGAVAAPGLVGIVMIRRRIKRARAEHEARALKSMTKYGRIELETRVKNDGLLERYAWIDNAFGPEQSSRRVWGAPGAGLSRGRYGNDAEKGRMGEEATAALLAAAFANVPGARIFHGLRWPGKDHADIDHVVLVGDRVALIDSKYWKSGAYWWDGTDLYHEGQNLDRTLKVGWAAVALSGALSSAGRPLQFRSWVALANPAATVDMSGSPEVRLLPAADAVREVYNWLTNGTSTSLVDRFVAHEIAQLVR